MHIYIDTKGMLQSSNNSSTTSLCSLGSSISDSNWDMVNTPTSSQDMSFDSSLSGNSSFMTQPSFASADEYSNSSHEFLIMSMAPQMDQSISHFTNEHNNLGVSATITNGCFPTHAIPVYEDFVSHHGLPTPPIHVDGYSSMLQSHTSMGYVAPSETTYMNNPDMQSPARNSNALCLITEYDSPSSDCHTDYSFTQSAADSFHDSFSPSSSACSSAMSTPARPATSRQIKSEVLESSAALQAVQNHASPKKIRRKQGSMKQSACGLPDCVKWTPIGKQKCTWKGCDRKFRRNEHLKRHEKTHSIKPEDLIKCEYCSPDKPKYFQKGRLDNYKDHLKRHLNKNATRTEYNELARSEYEEMCRKAGKRGKKAQSLTENETMLLEDAEALYQEHQELMGRFNMPTV